MISYEDEEGLDFLDRLFPARVTIACIVLAVVIVIGAGITAWLA